MVLPLRPWIHNLSNLDISSYLYTVILPFQMYSFHSLVCVCVFVISRVYFLRQGASFLSAGWRGGQRRAECLLPVRRHRQSLRERALPPRGEYASSFFFIVRCVKTVSQHVSTRVIESGRRCVCKEEEQEEEEEEATKKEEIEVVYSRVLRFADGLIRWKRSESYDLHAQPLAKLPHKFLYKLFFARAFFRSAAKSCDPRLLRQKNKARASAAVKIKHPGSRGKVKQSVWSCFKCCLLFMEWIPPRCNSLQPPKQHCEIKKRGKKKKNSNCDWQYQTISRLLLRTWKRRPEKLNLIPARDRVTLHSSYITKVSVVIKLI